MLGGVVCGACSHVSLCTMPQVIANTHAPTPPRAIAFASTAMLGIVALVLLASPKGERPPKPPYVSGMARLNAAMHLVLILYQSSTLHTGVLASPKGPETARLSIRTRSSRTRADVWATAAGSTGGSAA